MADPDDDAEKPGPHTDRNPGASPRAASVEAASHDRPRLSSTSESPADAFDMPSSSAPSDTLLSAPLPAAQAVEERLAWYERRLDELSDRVETLERRPANVSARSERSTWFWVIFLSGLAIAWQVLRWLR